MKKKVKVGIPRALAYYTFYPLWRTFLEKLGAEVIISKQTNRKVLEDGIKETVNDACIPVKVYHGHTFDLVGKVDYIFMPRMISADRKATFCPKFLGLPDMVRYSGVTLPEIIDVRYNRSGFPGGLLRFFIHVARAIKVRNPFRIAYAAISAFRVHKKYHKLLLQGMKPPQAIDLVFGDNSSGSNKTSSAKTDSAPAKPRKVSVALLGYPYAIYDPYISAGVYSKLENLNVNVITYEQIPLREMRRFSRIMPQNFFWYYSNQVCWAGMYLLENKELIDGIIHVTAFGCGPDAMVDKTLELEAKQTAVPFLSLTIDEHTGEGGVQTRLEAFVDMLTAKKAKKKAG